MTHREVEGGFLVRFDRGERLPSGIAEFCERIGIPAATATAIGAIEDVELGYFDVAAKSYERVKLLGSWELVSLTSFVATWEGRLFPHTHAVVSGPDFAARGGHLFDAVVSVTVEMRIARIGRAIERTMNAETGLHRMDL